MTDRPRLCATLTAPTMAALIRARDEVCDADLVELRLDSVSDPDVDGALRGRRCPVIVTCRWNAEGGRFQGSEMQRRALLEHALDAGAEFVDLEWRAGWDEVVRRREGRNVVLSHHDFDGVPADVASRAEAMLATGAAVVKIAVMATHLSDCLPLLEIGRRHRGRSLVLLAMGDAGLATRVFAARFGSCWSYAGDGVAPGQIDIGRLTGELAFRRIGPETQMYGLFGRSIQYSPSPAMHNAAFEDGGVDAAYLPLPAADADDAMRFANGIGMAGAGVTLPFKTDLIAHLDEVDAEATALGAINTMRRDKATWLGANTDGSGFLAGLGTGVPPGLRAAVLGTGGAARAVAAALRLAGAAVTVFGRTAESARRVGTAIGVGAAVRPVPPSSWDLLVNATPVGARPDVDRSACPEAVFEGGTVYDLVYAPEKTRLLQEAERGGCRIVGGLGMLVEQARLQQQWWTGRTPGKDVLYAAAVRSLAKRTERL
ncbi:MAG: type I 3-dehydroquinate dehydratase [Acidobacteriota bacterium]